MVTIVLGVGATRGWRSTLVGVGAGFAVLAVVVAALGLALSRVPIGPLRLIVGSLLLVFGLQWFRKGVMRVAAHGLAGIRLHPEDEPPEWSAAGCSGSTRGRRRWEGSGRGSSPSVASGTTSSSATTGPWPPRSQPG